MSNKIEAPGAGSFIKFLSLALLIAMFHKKTMNEKRINETINQVNVSVLRREDDRGHDGRDGDDEQPQPGREEEGDEGAKVGRPGLHSS